MQGRLEDEAQLQVRWYAKDETTRVDYVEDMDQEKTPMI